MTLLHLWADVLCWFLIHPYAPVIFLGTVSAWAWWEYFTRKF